MGFLNNKTMHNTLTLPPNWQNQNNKLTREYKFQNFQEAFDFVSKIAVIAEQVGHHPDISFGWGYATICITTHDKGNQITTKDIELATLINNI
jgi:4a-hydroxytetrahydrobiopterin dehydratase